MQAAAAVQIKSAFGIGIPERRLALFFRNFGNLIAAGVSIPESMLNAGSYFNDELADICRQVAPKLQQGVALHKALEPWRHRFPEITLPVIEVGEVSGTLDDAAFRLATAFEKLDGFTKQFRDVKIDPYKMATMAVLFRMILAVGTPFDQVVITSLITAAEVFAFYGLYRLIHRNLYRKPKLHILFDKIHLAIPHIGAIERSVASARWARSFGTMWNAGVPISQALEVASRSTLNAYYEVELARAAVATRTGQSLTETLARMELTPKHLLQILNTGEETADFGNALNTFVEAMEEEAIMKAQQETQAAMVVLYLVAGFIAMMMALGAGAATMGGRP